MGVFIVSLAVVGPIHARYVQCIEIGGGGGGGGEGPNNRLDKFQTGKVPPGSSIQYT
jgi:hypothetical protein